MWCEGTSLRFARFQLFWIYLGHLYIIEFNKITRYFIPTNFRSLCMFVHLQNAFNLPGEQTELDPLSDIDVQYIFDPTLDN